uniref:Reverse transcriptase Ty1/copia-type domain-containing protein n=1 Tax=Chenopodium quinoa TaxID=63459 RepID=A0A803MMI8_CHEQI
MKRFGYRQSNSNHTVFFKKKRELTTCLIIYVDDMIITGDDKEEIGLLKEKLFREFEMKDLGSLKYFLGIEVLRSNKGIFISQRKPDLAYASVVSRFMHKPQKQHLEAVYRILSRKSTSGYFTLVGGNLVSWKSKRQKVVAMSSAEAKFRGIAKITEVLWLRKLLSELGYKPKKSCKLYCDNMAAIRIPIRISENPVQHDRTKHVEIDRYFMKDHLKAKVISLPFVRSEDQLADIQGCYITSV